MLRFAAYLKKKGDKCVFFVNHHTPSLAILDDKQCDYDVVNLDENRNWEQSFIQRYGVDVWINDRLNTGYEHALNVKSSNIKLVTLDDRGSGACLADLNVAALVFDQLEGLQGKKVLTGVEYLILDQEINHFKRLRIGIGKVLVSMGGSDTYGVTLQVVQLLKDLPFPVTVVVGPGFEHLERLQQLLPDHFELRINVPSLIETFLEFDLLFTSGGVTPFEACASGLPCVVIATEDFEVPVGQQLEKMGVGMFAGHYSKIKKITLQQDIDIESMSKQAMLRVDVKGADRVCLAIENAANYDSHNI